MQSVLIPKQGTKRRRMKEKLAAKVTQTEVQYSEFCSVRKKTGSSFNVSTDSVVTYSVCQSITGMNRKRQRGRDYII